MAEEPSVEENIRNSFSRVKQHIKMLEEEIKANREFIIKQNKQIIFLLERLKEQSSEKSPKSPELSPKEASSSGNEGVYSLTHSLTSHSLTTHIGTYSDNLENINMLNLAPKKEEPIKIENSKVCDNEPLDIESTAIPFEIKKKAKPAKLITFHGMRKEIVDMFENLPKQELLTFLTIYQLEDEIKNVSYSDLADKLGLSEPCVRHYVSSLIRKGAPVEKMKYNNKIVLLRILDQFRELNLKKPLMAIYYRADPYQPTLKELF